MSYSMQIKEELSKQISSSRHCQIAELSGIFHYAGKGEIGRKEDGRVFFCLENDAVIRKCFTLLKKTFNINNDFGLKNVPIDESGHKSEIVIEDVEDSKRVFDAITAETVTQKACCRRAFLRGAFLAAGSISNPEKSYHLEYICQSGGDAEFIISLLSSFDIEAKTFVRKNSCVVYIKDGTQIVETLNVMEAHVALMNFENTRILKDMRNSVNRKVNCDTANIKKTVSAAQKMIDEINLLMGTPEYEALPEVVREMGQLRLDNPEATLTELGELCNPPVGKSGVNHRLRKLSEVAAKIKGGEL